VGWADSPPPCYRIGKYHFFGIGNKDAYAEQGAQELAVDWGCKIGGSFTKLLSLYNGSGTKMNGLQT
jgi:hypothetical protein